MSAATAPTAPITAAVSCQPLRCSQRATFRNGGATEYPGENQPGSQMAPSVRSSQCFSFQRVQRLIAHARRGPGVVVPGLYPAMALPLGWQDG